MARSSALRDLLQGLRQAPHEYRPSTSIFPDLNAERLVNDLDLAAVGSQRGKENQPPPDATYLDQIEMRIVERITSEQRKAYGILEDELRTYSERLASLDIDGRFGAIRKAAPAALSDFRAESLKGRDELHALRRHLLEIEEEQPAFKTKNKLHRPARVSGGASTFLKIAFLIILWVFETATNGSFLAKGNELGFLGGTTLAAGFAAVNIGMSLLLALVGVRQLNHRSFFRKLSGFASLIVFGVFVLFLNLALAHYRELSGTMIEEAGVEVIRRIQERPFDIVDVNSWIFFGLGMLFSILAFIDGLLLVDRYPGYGPLELRLRRARDIYARRKAELIDEMTDIRTDYADQLEEINRDLSVRRGEHDGLIANRARVIALFNQHQSHLQQTTNALLSTYREANIAERKKSPAHFSHPYSLTPFEVAANPIEERWKVDLPESFRKARELLETEIKEVHTEYEKTIVLYRQIDDLVVEESHGAPTP